MNQSGVFQEHIADEWTKVIGKNKTQPRVSAELKKDFTDSFSFLVAISNLSKVPLSDIVMGVTEARESQGIIFTTEGDGENEMIPVSNSLRGAASSLLSVVNEPQGDQENQDFISLPKTFVKPGGVKMLIRITGESMAPTFQSDDYIACKLLEQYDWNAIKDDHVYLIVNKDNETFLKRIKNRISEHGLIVCKSDNMNKKEYPDMNIEIGEISQIWDVQIQMSWKFPNPHGTVDDRFKEQDVKLIDHESKIQLLMSEMKKIKNEISQKG